MRAVCEERACGLQTGTRASASVHMRASASVPCLQGTVACVSCACVPACFCAFVCTRLCTCRVSLHTDRALRSSAAAHAVCGLSAPWSHDLRRIPTAGAETGGRCKEPKLFMGLASGWEGGAWVRAGLCGAAWVAVFLSRRAGSQRGAKQGMPGAGDARTDSPGASRLWRTGPGSHVQVPRAQRIRDPPFRPCVSGHPGSSGGLWPRRPGQPSLQEP